MIDNSWYDEEFVKAFTDFPLLIRTDTLKRLRAADVFRATSPACGRTAHPTRTRASPTSSTPRSATSSSTTKEAGPGPITRDQMGDRMEKKGIDPALSYAGKVKLADGKEVEVMPSGTPTAST